MADAATLKQLNLQKKLPKMQQTNSKLSLIQIKLMSMQKLLKWLMLKNQ